MRQEDRRGDRGNEKEDQRGPEVDDGGQDPVRDPRAAAPEDVEVRGASACLKRRGRPAEDVRPVRAHAVPERHAGHHGTVEEEPVSKAA